MIEKIKKFIEDIKKMITQNELKKDLKVNISMNQDMTNAIDLWSRMYKSQAPWNDENVSSLGLASQVSNELAKLVVLEMQSEITGSKRADYLQEQYKYVLDNLLQQIEYGNAKGGLMFKPYISGDKIVTDFIQADKFYPVAFNDTGKITSAIFVSQITKGTTIFTRLELHTLNADNTYTIINKAYMSKDKNTLGNLTSLQNIDEWANIEEEVTIKNIDKPLFGYYKVPMANTIDVNCPLGVSVYSRAVDLIADADKQYSRMMWEYEASEKAIYVDELALWTTDATTGKRVKVAKGKNRIYKSLNTGSEEFFKDYSPAIREEFWNGLNNILRRIESNCGLAFGTISDVNEVDKTATEIKMSKQKSYDTVSNMQKSLKVALEDLIYAMDVMATLYKLAPAGTYEASFDFKDSILVDEEKERQQDMADVAAGLMNAWEYRVKWFGETEEVAKTMIPEQANILL